MTTQNPEACQGNRVSAFRQFKERLSMFNLDPRAKGRKPQKAPATDRIYRPNTRVASWTVNHRLEVSGVVTEVNHGW